MFAVFVRSNFLKKVDAAPLPEFHPGQRRVSIWLRLPLNLPLMAYRNKKYADMSNRRQFSVAWVVVYGKRAAAGGAFPVVVFKPR